MPDWGMRLHYGWGNKTWIYTLIYTLLYASWEHSNHGFIFNNIVEFMQTNEDCLIQSGHLREPCTYYTAANIS